MANYGGTAETSDGGYEAAKRWIVEGATETERAELAAVFSGEQLRVFLMADVFPSLVSVLGSHRSPDSFEVDFSSSAWLSGFRAALVEELGGEPG